MVKMLYLLLSTLWKCTPETIDFSGVPCENAPSHHIRKLTIFTTLPTTIELPSWGQQKKMGNNLLGRTVAQSKGNSCLHENGGAPDLCARQSPAGMETDYRWFCEQKVAGLCWGRHVTWHDVRSWSELSIYASSSLFSYKPTILDSMYASSSSPAKPSLVSCTW